MRRGRGRQVIAGLPIDTWLLMLASTVPGLVLVVMAYRVHRGADLGRGARSDRSGSSG